VEDEGRAELIFGIVAAIGTPIDFVAQALEEELKSRGYESDLVHLSVLMNAFSLPTSPPPKTAKQYIRLKTLISRGDELRKQFGPDALASLATSHISAKRPDSEPRSFPGKAFILRQLKHPEEVYLLRSVYEDGFHVIGLYCPVKERKKTLRVHYGMTEKEADELIKLDEHERPEFGQRFRDTFHLSDCFVAVSDSSDGVERTKQQLSRFLDLLFGNRMLTPTKDEFAMYIAHAAAIRSSSLSRQVGASILNDDGDIISIGTNEVPRYGGGSYWEKDLSHSLASHHDDARDHIIGKDSNDLMQRSVMAEILAELEPKWAQLTNKEREEKLSLVCDTLKASGARIMSLTEFGRAVHAEMSALMAAARVGLSVKNTTLFTTTFPCHGCTRHIVDAGIRRVVYVEPYPKSLAAEFHSDAISVEDRLWINLDLNPMLAPHLAGTMTCSR
jgi:deoxycytidylate deaminase